MMSTIDPDAGKKPYIKRLLANKFDYSYYGYGIYHSSILAQKLGISKISSLEFGVAGGNGLVEMERHARWCERRTGVKVDIYGFDTGEGMTPPEGHLDMPYRFAEGNYKMDVPKLKARLKRAKLILGDVKATVGSFLNDHKPAPIGFVSFDLDYYSSTMNAFSMFKDGSSEKYFLPRIQCYFDDVLGDEISSYNEHVGELAAIRDFNEQNKNVKIGQSQVFKRSKLSFSWYHQIYLMHRFKQPRYNDYISSATPASLALK